MNFLRLIRPNEIIIPPEDLNEDIRPMSELEQFASATRSIVGGLDEKITALDAEINRKIAQLGDLRRIRAGQELALRYMEGEI